MACRFLYHILLMLFITYYSPTLCQPQKIYLSPKTIGGEKQSKFIDITEFVPLKTPKGISIIDNNYIIPSQKYFILYDFTLKKILFFTKDGNFVKQFHLKKYGEPQFEYDDKKEQLRLVIFNKNYTLTNKDLMKIRANYNSTRNLKYYKTYVIDLNKNQLVLERIATTSYDMFDAKKYYDNYYYLSDISLNQNTKDTLGYELKILRNNQTVKTFFPFNKKAEPKYKFEDGQHTPSMFLYATDTPYISYTARPYSNLIYKLNKDNISPIYEIILPIENILPSSFYTEGFKKKVERKNFESNNGWMLRSITDIKNLKQYLFFNIDYFRNTESYVYDKQNGTFYKTMKIKGDTSQYNLQLMTKGLGTPFNSKFYTTVKATDLLDFYNNNKEKKIEYPKTLDSFFKKADKNSNIVIVAYMLKD